MVVAEELVTFETAKLAKGKGFDEECMNYWEWYVLDGKEYGPLAHERPLVDWRKIDSKLWEAAQKNPVLFNKIFWPVRNATLQPWLYARPTQDLLERWLREQKKTYVTMIPCLSAPELPTKWEWMLLSELFPVGESNEQFASYELAREAALLHALNLLP